MSRLSTRKKKKSLSKAQQATTALAFRRIVREQKNPEGLPWKPARILEELWELWPDRPTGEFEKSNFVESGTPTYQQIDRLKRGETDSFKTDVLLYALVTRFVLKHTPSGEFVVPGEDADLIYQTGEQFLSFAYADGLMPHDQIYEEYGYKPLIEKYGIFVCEIYKDRAAFEKGKDRKYLAFRIPRSRDPGILSNMWPAALVYQDFLYCEVGFFAPSRSSVFLRSICSALDPEHTIQAGLRADEALMDCNYRHLTIALRVSHDERTNEINLVTEEVVSDVMANDDYSLAISEYEPAYDICAKLLNFLDKP